MGARLHRTMHHNRIPAPVEESGRPHLPVKEEIAGSKPVGRAGAPKGLLLAMSRRQRRAAAGGP